MANYGVTAGDNATWQDYVQSGTVGLATSSIGSAGVSWLGPKLAQPMSNLISRPISATNNGLHSAGSSTWGNVLTHSATDRIIGGAQGVTNELLRDTGDDEPRQPLRATIQGFVSGVGGYAPGMHSR